MDQALLEELCDDPLEIGSEEEDDDKAISDFDEDVTDTTPLDKTDGILPSRTSKRLSEKKRLCGTDDDYLILENRDVMRLNDFVPVNNQSSDNGKEVCTGNLCLYQCELCGMELRSKMSRQQHIQTQHIREKNYNCPVCHRSFSFPKNLRSHLLVHNEVKDYECPICQKRIAHKASLDSHIKNIHQPSKEALLSCPLCDKKIKDKHSLKCHLSAVHIDKTVKCLHPSCTKMFTNKSYMQTHLKTHVKDKPYECNSCKQKFKTKSYMKKHQLSHSGERPHQCEKCGRGYLTVSHLNAHMKVHTGEKPHQCVECGKCFRFKRHLDFHVNTHSGSKPFECTLCGYKTGYKSNWYAHRKRHDGNKSYECYLCEKLFIDRQALLKHINAHGRRTVRDKPEILIRQKEETNDRVLGSIVNEGDQQMIVLSADLEIPIIDASISQLVQFVTINGNAVPSIILLEPTDSMIPFSLDDGILLNLEVDDNLEKPLTDVVDSLPLLPPGFLNCDTLDSIDLTETVPVQKIVHITDQSLASASVEFDASENLNEDSLTDAVQLEESFKDVHFHNTFLSSEGIAQERSVQIIQSLPVDTDDDCSIAMPFLCEKCNSTFVLYEEFAEHFQLFHGLAKTIFKC